MVSTWSYGLARILCWPCLPPKVELKGLAPCPVRCRLQFTLTRTRTRRWSGLPQNSDYDSIRKRSLKPLEMIILLPWLICVAAKDLYFQDLTKICCASVGQATLSLYDFTLFFRGLKYELPDIWIHIYTYGLLGLLATVWRVRFDLYLTWDLIKNG